MGALGVFAVLTLVASLGIPSQTLIAPALSLLGASYATILVVDNPTLDGRAAVVGAALLGIGELAHLAIDARLAVTDVAGTTARRVGSIAFLVLVALAAGGALTALVDLARVGGLAIEALGVGAAVGAVGLLAVATRAARKPGTEAPTSEMTGQARKTDAGRQTLG